MIKCTCTKDIFRIIQGRKQLVIQKKLRTHNFIEKRKLWKYLGGLLFIMFDKVDLKNITNKWINDNRKFDKEHIIQRRNVTQSNIPEYKH